MLKQAAACAAVFVLLAGCERAPLARHSDIAAAVIAQTGAPDFVDASTAERPAIKHEPSGMVCPLPRDGVFDHGLFPANAANPGAHCATATGDVASTFIVVRFTAPITLDIAFAEAQAATAGRAEAQPWSGEASAADRSSPEGLTHFRIARFEARVDGAPRYLRVAMTEADGWYLQQIVSAPLERAEDVEARSGEEWRAVLREFAAAHAGP